jgi:hypothetical protein
MLQITSGVFDTLHNDDLSDMPNLEYFGLFNSNLKTISSGLFEATPNMTWIWFNWNQIERVGHDLFTPLDLGRLQTVQFADNRCIDQFAQGRPQIEALIENLRTLCPYDEEEVPSTTTTEAETCVEGSLDEFVCEMREEVDVVRLHQLSTAEEVERQRETIAGLDREQKLTGETVSELQSELAWMREELLRLTTNPCACK